MSKYFGFVGDSAYDFKFTPDTSNKGWYTFSLGNYQIARVIPRNSRKNPDRVKSWSVIVLGNREPEIPGLVHGFVSRHHAVTYALSVHPLTASNYNDSLKDIHTIEGEVGEILKARAMNRYSNAVVIKNTDGMLTLLTDFGNIIEQALTEVRRNFKLHRGYIEAKGIGFPLESIENRIDTQIQLLQEAKKSYNFE